MPDSSGRIRGISVPRVPWLEDAANQQHNKSMGFVKHTQSEDVEVVSAQEHEDIETYLRRIGKVSLAETLEPEEPAKENNE